jgi:hypothetical protein
MGGSVGTPYALSCLGRNTVPYIDQMS